MRRAARKGFEWTKVVGLGFVLMAYTLVTDQDYPVVRGTTTHRPQQVAAPKPKPKPTPRALAPRGSCGESDAFAWSWQGPPTPWCVSVLDASLQEVARLDAGTATSCAIPAEVTQRLAGGEALYWRVEGRDQPECRSSPVLFRRG